MDTKANSVKNHFLSGNGEMATLTRLHNWSESPVGTSESWPQSLKTILNTVLNSRFPMFLFWGKELTCFYNDAYRPSLGNNGKHPSILGMSGKEAWPEIWTVIGPLIDQVLSGGGSTWSEDQLIPIFRNGKIEDVYWTFSYSPVQDEQANISGVLVTCSETTAKVNTLKYLEKNNRRYYSNIMMSPVAMGVFTGENHVIEIANEKMLELMEKTADEVVNKPVFEALPETTGQGLEQLLNVVYKTGERISIKERPISLYGKDKLVTTYMDFMCEPINEPDGTISGIVVIASEVTDQVMARISSEENEEKLNVIIEASDLGTWELNFQTKEVSYSKRYLEIFGYKEKIDLSHEQLRKHLHPDDFETRELAFKEAFVTGILNYEARLIWNDGSIHWMHGKGKVIYDESNVPMKMIGTIRDITEEKHYRGNLNNALLKSEARYHLMVEEVQDYAILFLNQNGVIENWNKGAEKIKGYKPEEIVGQNFSVFYTESDRENNLPQTLLSQARSNDRAVQQGWRVRKDKSLFWASVVITAVHDENSNVIGFSKVTHDLTEKKQAEDKLKQYAEQLEKKNHDLEKMNSELQSFAYVSSHDLQEPLRKIQTFASRIEEKEHDTLSETGKDYFRRMQDAAGRMQILIQDLLAYSRTSTSERKFVTCELAEIVDDVRKYMRETLLEKNGKIEADIQGTIDVIPFQFRQLLENLIGNALKFARKDIAPVIKISSRIIIDPTLCLGNDSICHLVIEDNGIGFDPQYKQRIFEIFQRLHGKSEYSGTGIGLAIVKKIVENHGGIIEATSEPDQGARFDIYIPVSKK